MICRVSVWLLLLNLLVSPALANDPSPETLIEAGHWKRARVFVERQFQSNPNDAETAYLLSRVKLAYGETDEALKLAENAVKLDRRNSMYRLQLARVYGEMAQNAGAFTGMRLGRRFKDETEAAISLDPKNLEAKVALLEFYLRAPALVGGSKNKARAVAEEILRFDAARGYLAQARIAAQAKETAKLEGLYLKAVEVNPRSYPALISLAYWYASDQSKRYDLAEKYARGALHLDPARVGAYTLLAMVFALQEQWQDLDRILTQSENNVPDNLNPHFQAGRVLLLRGKELQRAERYFRKYLTQDNEPGTPTPAHAHWRLALVLEKQGRKPEAIAELQTALRIKPNLDDAKKDLRRLQ